MTNTSNPERTSAQEDSEKLHKPTPKAASAAPESGLKLVRDKGKIKKQRGELLAEFGTGKNITELGREKLEQAATVPPVTEAAPAEVETPKEVQVPKQELVLPVVAPKKETHERRAGIEPMATIVVRTKRGLEAREIPFANFYYSGDAVYLSEAGTSTKMQHALPTSQQKVFRRLYLQKLQRATLRHDRIQILKEANQFFEVLEQISGTRRAVPAELPEELREFSPRLAEIPVLPDIARTPTSDDFLDGGDLAADIRTSETIEQSEEIPAELTRVLEAPSFDDYARTAASGAVAVAELVEQGVLIGEIQKSEGVDRDDAVAAAKKIEADFQDAETRVQRIARATGGPENDVKLREKDSSDEAWDAIVAGRQQEAELVAKVLEPAGEIATKAGDIENKVGEAVISGVQPETVERVGKESLVKSYLRQAAEKAGLFGLINYFRKGKAAETAVAPEAAKTPEAKPEAKPDAKVPSGFAQAVEKARKAAETPKARFLRERLKGALTMSWLEWRQAEAFRYRTNEIAKNIAENYSGAAVRYRNNEIYREALIDSATTQLRDRLGKMSRFGSMRTYRGEKTADVLEKRIEQVRAHLKTELEKAAAENQKIDGAELAKAFRENIDPEYWKRYVWGSAELALAAGGAALVWLKPASAAGAKALGTKIATRGAIQGGKEVVGTLTEAAGHAASLEAPTSPEAVDNARVVSKNIWNTVRQWYVDHGVNPSNRQILEASKEIAKANDVSVPEWNITGSVSARRLATGLVLKGFGKLAKEIVANV